MSTADNESPDTTQIVTVEELYSTEQTEGTRSQTLYFGKAGMNRFVHSSRDLILCCASHVSHCETYYFLFFGLLILSCHIQKVVSQQIEYPYQKAVYFKFILLSTLQ